jgi:hypothetical protein
MAEITLSYAPAIMDKFCKFFSEFGELCFQIGNVERPLHPSDFTRGKDKQIINPEYYDEVKKKFPNTLLSFYMALGRNQIESITCYLQENGNVVVEFYNTELAVEKTIHYATIQHLRENKTSLIHHLTKRFAV